MSFPNFFKKITYSFIFGYTGSSLLSRLSLVVNSRENSSLWCVGFSLQWLLLLWNTGSRLMGFRVTAHKFRTPWNVKPSWTRDWTHVPCTGRQSLILSTTREVCSVYFLSSFSRKKKKEREFPKAFVYHNELLDESWRMRMRLLLDLGLSLLGLHGDLLFPGTEASHPRSSWWVSVCSGSWDGQSDLRVRLCHPCAESTSVRVVWEHPLWAGTSWRRGEAERAAVHLRKLNDRSVSRSPWSFLPRKSFLKHTEE